MFKYSQTMLLGIKAVFREPLYRFIIIALIPTLLVAFIFIPTLTIPGNTFAFQLSLYAPQDYVLLVLLATMGALLIAMNVYSYKKTKTTKERLGATSKGGIGGFLGAFASIFGSASCPMCVASLFGFLGLGAVGFLVQYQWWIFIGSALLVLVSLYFAARKVAGICDEC